MSASSPLRATGRMAKRAVRWVMLVGPAVRAWYRAAWLLRSCSTVFHEIGPLDPVYFKSVTVFGMRHELTGGRDWHADAWSGRRWAARFHRLIDVNCVRGGSDIKWPWELSRCQYLASWAIEAAVSRNQGACLGVMRVLADWMRSNPVGFGVNWTCSMEVGVRAINWLFVREMLKDMEPWSPEWDDRIVAWIVAHAEYIENNIEDWGEYSQNHLVADLVGLFCIYAEVGRSENRRKAEEVKQKLERCMFDQVYPDGVSFENSTWYHALVAELFATAVACGRRNGISFGKKFEARLRDMIAFIAALADSKGQVPLIGDCDDGRVLVPTGQFSPGHVGWLIALGVRLYPHQVGGRCSEADLRDADIAVTWTIDSGTALAQWGQTDDSSMAFPDGGIYVLRGGATRAVFVGSPTGVHGTGPHRHNDALSVLLDMDGQPILTDSGSYCYQHDVFSRRAFRSARAHSTALVDGLEHNDITPLFALSEDRIHAEVEKWSSNASTTAVRGRMYSFERIGVIWSRSVEVDRYSGSVKITDQFSGDGWPHDIELCWRHSEEVEIVLDAAAATRSSASWWAGSARFTSTLSCAACGEIAMSMVEKPVSYRYRVAAPAFATAISVQASAPVTIVTAVVPPGC